jgi:formylglycine-generating enzyme required for sulfatase activity
MNRDRDSTLDQKVGSPESPRAGESSNDLATGSPSQIGSQVVVAGTPLYMAPELWRGEPATRRSDLYSLGILLYELLAGTAPHRGIPMAELPSIVQSSDIPRLRDVAPDVDPALATIVDRLVARKASARFTSADAVLVALEEIAAPTSRAELPDGNPYRGLSAFESTHSALFFGRRSELRELVNRVRTEGFVVVVGDSGTGKSSLCRAGVLPLMAEHDGWTCVDVIPGRHPVRSLAAALAERIGTDEAELAALLRATPEVFSRVLRRNIAAGGSQRRVLLFVDQLEELLTLSEPTEARQVAAALAALAVRTPSVRVLASCRSDFLSRVARLPGLADEMVRGLYFLPQLAGERIREVIVRPAAAKGVEFESEELIDALVEQTEQAPGGLPLLQFTLAELWDVRDTSAQTIRAESLAALGGVGGALTRHADRLLSGLRDDERDAARRILLKLVTAEGTRARRSEAELLAAGPGREVERQALEGLVRGRLVVANDAQDGAYELAHEALLSSWSTLQGWLQRGAADHAARARVEQAAAVWERMGRARDLLWGRRQLAEVRSLDRKSMGEREGAFLAAAGKAIRRRRLLGAGAAAVLVIGAVVVGLAIRAKARRELEAVIVEQLHAATTAGDSARQLANQRDTIRDRAFKLFDARRWADGEAAWSEVETLAPEEERQYRLASAYLESALRLDPGRGSLRDGFADLTFERLLRAERDRHGDLADDLATRMIANDNGRYQVKLAADARVEIEIVPAGTRVWSERPGAPRQLLGQAPLPALTLPPGSVILSLEAPGHVAARLPILLSREETLRLRVELPSAPSAPPGMIYVPPGRFLFGSADGAALRRGFLNTSPLREVSTGGYFIGRHEVTFAAWIEFLDALPPEERRHRTPSSTSTQSSLTLTEIGPARWRLALRPTTRTYTVETGERLRYEQRASRAEQDWLKLPVAAVSYEDAVAFAGWLDRTGRIRGARLCDEYEWERAARGADGRVFPSGATLAPDDANIDVTYGRAPLAFGPDEVGSHPGSRSPVGADDMAGNVWEWTRSVQSPDAPVARGGGWYNNEISARSMNREHGEPTERHPLMGVRLCATPQSSLF